MADVLASGFRKTKMDQSAEIEVIVVKNREEAALA